MIHKFEKLASVGKFRDYQAAGQVSLNKLSLVYADNGSGKTTLTSVLRSLSINEPDILRKRISTNATLPQSVLIIRKDDLNANHTHTLRTTGWSTNYPDIEIFDIHFVNDNIYSGFSFTEDHKRQLHHFVIGAQGVAIKHQIEQTKNNRSNTRTRIDNLVTQIVQTVGHGFTNQGIQDFINIRAEEHGNIESRVQSANAALNAAQAGSLIRALSSLVTLTIGATPIDFNAINNDLQTSTSTIQDESLKSLFNNHTSELNSNGLTNSQDWLKNGYSYFQNKVTNSAQEIDCPFCKQEINAEMEIIKSFSLRFNDAFNKYTQRLQDHIRSLQQLNLDSLYERIETVKTSNEQTIQTWNIHLQHQAPSLLALPDKQEVQQKLNALIQVLQAKIQNPTSPIDLTESNDLENFRTLIGESIRGYNEGVNSFNIQIDAFKNGIQTEATAKIALDNALIVRARFSPIIEGLLVQLNAERINATTLDTSYTALIAQERTAATTFFSTYKDRINHYLNNIFKTPFLIDNVAHVAPQGRATQSKLNYKLTVDGHDIAFDPSNNRNAKDCLSEGDKSTLALAFFLAKLDVDPDIANKVVVIDDPLSSFDSNRRAYTIKLITDMLPKVRQLIILSHNEFFLSEIYKNTNRAERKALRIVTDFITKNSKIEDLDLEKLVEHEYFKHIGELESFLASPDIAKKKYILGLTRNVIEAHLKFKFFRQLAGLPENQRTFGRIIDELVNQSVAFRDTNTATIIAQLRLINGVSCEAHHGEGVPDYATLGLDPNTITVTELGNLVTDVLDLIDNKI